MIDINTTIIIITYKSDKIIYDFIKKIPSKYKTIIIENSQNYLLKKNIEEKYKNISFYIRENNGVSSALNFAVEKVDTKYFLQISPDLQFDFQDLDIFLNYAKKLNNSFAALGPRFINVKNKSHKQINKNFQFGEVDSVHGSCMFINKENFYKIGKFDENFFLYFEETDYCRRAKFIGYKSYQINEITAKQVGRSVIIDKKGNLDNILTWHFIWSKFYFSKKKYGLIISIFFFLPTLLRSLFKFCFTIMINNKKENDKYKYRIKGLLNSFIGKKSYLRP